MAVRAVYYGLTEGFSIKRIQINVDLPDHLSVPSPEPKTLNQLITICKQRFTYLKKGSQAYAFLSEDGQYVLKLFKYHHMKPAEWLLDLRLPENMINYRNHLVHRRRHRIDLTLNSYKIAAVQLKDESALTYAQIMPSSEFSLPVTLQDSIGRKDSIDLAHHGFAIQRCAQLVYPSFETWLAQNDLQSARQAIDSLVTLVALRSKKGIQDSDPDLHKNAGLIGTQAVFIDIGGFHLNPKMQSNDEMKHDMKKVFNNLRLWLKKHSPSLCDYLEQKIEEC